MSLTARVEWEQHPQGWWVDGLPLNHLAWSVEEIRSGLGLPARKGENIDTAGEPGERHRDKVHGARTLSLKLFLIPQDHPLADHLEGELRRLQRILGRSMVTLTRAVTIDGRVEHVTAAGEVTDAVEASVLKPSNAADLVVDFHLFDPFWYLPERTKQVEFGAGARRVWNPATVGEHYDNRIVMRGPLTTPRLTNHTLGQWVEYSGSIADGSTVTLDSREMTAVDDGGNSVAADVSKSGRWWMELASERNELELTGDSGSGRADVAWRPALL
jgi:hypothetical protein